MRLKCGNSVALQRFRIRGNNGRPEKQLAEAVGLVINPPARKYCAVTRWQQSMMRAWWKSPASALDPAAPHAITGSRQPARSHKTNTSAFTLLGRWPLLSNGATCARLALFHSTKPSSISVLIVRIPKCPLDSPLRALRVPFAQALMCARKSGHVAGVTYCASRTRCLARGRLDDAPQGPARVQAR